MRCVALRHVFSKAEESFFVCIPHSDHSSSAPTRRTNNASDTSLVQQRLAAPRSPPHPAAALGSSYDCVVHWFQPVWWSFLSALSGNWSDRALCLFWLFCLPPSRGLPVCALWSLYKYTNTVHNFQRMLSYQHVLNTGLEGNPDPKNVDPIRLPDFFFFPTRFPAFAFSAWLVQIVAS